MRTVIAHLWDTTEPAVTAVLDAAYPAQPGPTWVASVAGDVCLYISIYRHGPVEYPAWPARFDRVGGHPDVSVAADISGRHNGWPQVEHLMGVLLSRFRGWAEDDDSDRFWSLAELVGEHRVGHRFGEYWRG